MSINDYVTVSGTAPYYTPHPSSSGASGVVPAGKVIGQFYGVQWAPKSGASNAAPVFQAMYAVPMILKAGTLDRIAVNHFGATGAAGETERLGIYSDNGKAYPGALLIDAGTVATDVAGAVKAATIAQAVTDGIYWLVSVAQGGAASTAGILFYGSDQEAVSPLMPTQASLYQRYIAYRQTGISGALPANFTATPDPVTAAVAVPQLAVRYSA